MSRVTRRRAADAPVVISAPLARPSGRFDSFVDMGNPMKGINLFPYLRRRVEGRALGALSPSAVLELSRTVREAAMPRRWPREVVHIACLFVCIVGIFSSFFVFFPSCQLQGEWQRTVGSQGDQPGRCNYPGDLALTPDESFLLMVDGASVNRRVAVLRASDGTWVRQLTGPPGTLPIPYGVAIVPSTGEVLVSDIFRDQVVRFRSIDDDMVIGTLGTVGGSGPTQFDSPSGLAVLDGSQHPSVCFFFFLNIFLCRNHVSR
jgi:hypothetical protein